MVQCKVASKRVGEGKKEGVPILTHPQFNFLIITFKVLHERVLCWIVVALREVVVYLFNWYAHIFQYFPEVLSCMLEHNSSMVWIVLLNEDMTIETAHVLNAECSDATK